MGENKKHYYIKKKQSTSKRSSFTYRKPTIESGASTPEIKTDNNHGLLNMELAQTQSKNVWGIALIRWSLIVLISILLYFSMSFLSVGAVSVKDELILNAKAGAINLQIGAEAFKKLDIENASTNFRLADKNFGEGLNTFAQLGQSYVWLSGATFSDWQIWQAQVLMDGGQHLSRAGIYISEAIKPILNYWSGVTAASSDWQSAGEDIGQLLIQNQKKINLALEEVKLADAAFSKLSVNNNNSEYSAMILEAQEQTKNFREALEILGGLGQRLPAALGFGIPRSYLFLNQNSNELRPTGGFIGSLALAELDQGKITSLSVDTTQRLDGQNKYSDLELPAPLKAVTAYYGLRDANWEPDFPTSIETITKLYQQSGGGTVDGVIAVTPKLITDILKVIGPVGMSKYGFDITSENFVDKTQKHIEIVAASEPEPKQILIDFTPLFINRVMSASSGELQIIGEKLFAGLVNKNILVYFKDSTLQSAVRLLGWSGEVTSVSDTQDYLYVVDANLGGNKSSGSIVRQIDLKTEIQSDATIVNNLQIKYTHTGTSIFPDGVNKNYVRVYVPNGSKVVQTAGHDAGTHIETDTMYGKQIVAFWLTTNPGETKIVNLQYKLPFKVPFKNGEANYELLLQKQPGADRTTISTSIQVGENMDLVVAGSDPIYQDLIYSDRLVKDELITAKIRRY
ncbi:MAG: DUF4012 domain-containing protein [Patescibacteria group bacterium]|nr:DUF4012 domain-containing protein [Patescibacteria group bacterium]